LQGSDGGEEGGLRAFSSQGKMQLKKDELGNEEKFRFLGGGLYLVAAICGEVVQEGSQARCRHWKGVCLLGWLRGAPGTIIVRVSFLMLCAGCFLTFH
jgi:hypothetical protein